MITQKLMIVFFLGLSLVGCGGQNTNGPRRLPFAPVVPAKEETIKNAPKLSLPNSENYSVIERTGEVLLLSAKDFRYDGKSDLLTSGLQQFKARKVVIHAENLVIAAPLKLTGGVIEIVADSLTFSAEGSLDVSGSMGNLGESGQSGGTLLLQIGKIVQDTLTARPRLIAHGGRGGDARPGRKGSDGKSRQALSGVIIYEEIYREHCQVTPRGGLALAESCYVKLEQKRGSKTCPTDGTDASPASAPGAGGRAGIIKVYGAAKSIASLMSSASKGIDGKRGETYEGGRGGLPTVAAFMKVTIKANGRKRVEKIGGCPETRAGKGASAPEVKVLEDQSSSLSLTFTQDTKNKEALFQYASDLVAQGFSAEARAYLQTKKGLGFHFHALYLKTFLLEEPILRDIEEVTEVTEYLLTLKSQPAEHSLKELFLFEGLQFHTSLASPLAQEITQSLRFYDSSEASARDLETLLGLIEVAGSIKEHRDLIENILLLKERENFLKDSELALKFLARTLSQSVRFEKFSLPASKVLTQFQSELNQVVNSQSLQGVELSDIRERLLAYWAQELVCKALISSKSL